jgi:hypothetical protein
MLPPSVAAYRKEVTSAASAANAQAVRRIQHPPKFTGAP